MFSLGNTFHRATGRAMDAEATADAENERLDKIIKATGLSREQAHAREVTDWELERRTKEAGAAVTPAEAKLLKDHEQHPENAVDRVCDDVTKYGC